MKHQITLETIEGSKTTILLASSSLEMKKLELKIKISEGIVSFEYVVVQRDLAGNIFFEKSYNDANLAIEDYNSLDCINN